MASTSGGTSAASSSAMKREVLLQVGHKHPAGCVVREAALDTGALMLVRLREKVALGAKPSTEQVNARTTATVFIVKRIVVVVVAVVIVVVGKEFFGRR
mmetsp:Transcript_1720/g.2510  ORF Transcript_1720/g.2510 Transcript_1720/m.2510 type:complete len:99 (-) Transcript_1720:82-378(-)